MNFIMSYITAVVIAYLLFIILMGEYPDGLEQWACVGFLLGMGLCVVLISFPVMPHLPEIPPQEITPPEGYREECIDWREPIWVVPVDTPTKLSNEDPVTWIGNFKGMGYDVLKGERNGVLEMINSGRFKIISMPYEIREGYCNKMHLVRNTE